MRTLDVDQFEERAAICEFDGGMSRFDAETAAAQEQGLARWQAVKFAKEARDAQRNGYSAGGGHSSAPVAREQRPVSLPGMQPTSEEKNGSVPERDANVWRDRMALLSLWNERRAAV